MMHRLSLITPALVIAALAGACSIAASDMTPTASQAGSSFDAAVTTALDGGVGTKTYNPVGSALCNIKQGACEPDDRTACSEGGGPIGVESDAGPSPANDAGTPDAGGAFDAGTEPLLDGAALACRVVRRGSTVGPQCTVAGTGEDGAACRASPDCAVGFDCVGNPGQCRRYCCLGSKSCGADRICDKQTIAGEQTIVPVCAPIHPCQLLTAKACPDNETCAIADQRDGRTSCVTIGSASVGEACEYTNCGAGLACLGQEGSRSCFKLCVKSKMGECPTDTKCKGSAPLFTDPEQGVCIKDVASY